MTRDPSPSHRSARLASSSSGSCADSAEIMCTHARAIFGAAAAPASPAPRVWARTSTVWAGAHLPAVGARPRRARRPSPLPSISLGNAPARGPPAQYGRRTTSAALRTPPASSTSRILAARANPALPRADKRRIVIMRLRCSGAARPPAGSLPATSLPLPLLRGTPAARASCAVPSSRSPTRGLCAS